MTEATSRVHVLYGARIYEAHVLRDTGRGPVRVRIPVLGDDEHRVRRDHVYPWRDAQTKHGVVQHGVVLFTPEASLAAVPKGRPPARSPAYLAYVRTHPCCLCGATPPSDAHHWGRRGVGQKTDDYRTVPLCRGCHDHVHAQGPGKAVERLLRVQVDLLVAWLAKGRP